VKKAKIIWLLLLGLGILVNIIAWTSRSFCDYYVEHIFPVLGSTYSKITAAAFFSVGECMIVFAILFCICWIMAGILRFVIKKDWTKRCFGGMGRSFAWVGLLFFWIMTCNCFIQYHASAFEDKYMEQVRTGGFSNRELAALRDYIVVNVNALSEKMQRDEQGYLLCDTDMYQTAAFEMQKLGEHYSQLKGYYPPPKKLVFSNILSQSYMMGYYFPFSMEANYNKEMYIINVPAVMCHELAHLKGIIQEDEANLIGYLACIDSKDLFFQYSGYMSVLSYVENAFLKAIGRDETEYNKHPRIRQQVYDDDLFLTKEAWEKVEEKAIVDTQTVKKVSNAATEATLKINGVEEGMKSYSGVVELLLYYYDGVLF